MADPILDAIKGIRDDVRSGNTQLNLRIDSMVTRAEHVAEVRRLDQAISTQTKSLERIDQTVSEVVKDLDDHKTLAAAQHADMQKAISDQFASFKENMKADRRWVLGWATGAVSVAVTVASFIIKTI